MKRNGWERFRNWIAIIAATVSIVYQIMSTGALSEAQKYFILSMIFAVYIFLYLRIFVEARIAELERRSIE